MMTYLLLTMGLWITGGPVWFGDVSPAAAKAGQAQMSHAAMHAMGDSDQIRLDGERVAALMPPSREAPKRSAEMRALALYGPREFDTFSVRSAGVAPVRKSIAFTPPLHRQAEDSWFGFDKVQHFTFSFLWTLGTQYVAVNKGRLTEAQALPLSLTTSAALGLSKEFYDLHIGPTRTFSYRDLVADGIGILLAAGLILL